MDFIRLSLPIDHKEIDNLIAIEYSELSVIRKSDLENLVSDQKKRRLDAINDFSDSQKLEFYRVYGEQKKSFDSKSGVLKNEIIYADPKYTRVPEIEKQRIGKKRNSLDFIFSDVDKGKLLISFIILSIFCFSLYKCTVAKRNERQEIIEKYSKNEDLPVTQTAAQLAEVGTAISISSDIRAKYIVLSKKILNSEVELLVKRSSEYDVSYSLILFDCKGNYKYLGTENSRASTELRSNPDSQMSSIIPGSIKSDEEIYACKH